LSAIAALVMARSGGVGVKDFVFGAMTSSFLTAPLFAWMAMDTMNGPQVPSQHRYGAGMRALCWLGLLFLLLFSGLFVWQAFLSG